MHDGFRLGRDKGTQSASCLLPIHHAQKRIERDWEEEQRVHPCFLVKQMWLYHIADVVNYCHDMMLLCGRVVGPNPDADGALDYAAKLKRDQTARNLLQERFGVDYDEKVWGRSMEAELKRSRQMKRLLRSSTVLTVFSTGVKWT
jgi:hypothetical protein